MMLMAYLSYMLAEVSFYGSYFCLPFSYSSCSRRILVLCIYQSYQVLINFFACCSSSIWVEFLRYSSVGLSCPIIHGTMWPRAREWPPSTVAYLREIFQTLHIVSRYPNLWSHRLCNRHAFATLSFVAEIFLFLYVGMDALDIEKWRFVSDRYDEIVKNFAYVFFDS